jgi:hypothetical protein
MNLVELLVIEDRFQITGRGVILTPDFSTPKKRWQNRIEKVSVITPAGQAIEANAEINHVHFSIRDPQVPLDRRWRIVVMITDRSKEELPVGSRVLVLPEARDAIIEPTEA